MFDVLKIERHIRLERRIAPCGHLPEPRNAGLYVQPPVVLQAILLEIVGGMGPWANETHIAAQNVPELRKFVEAIFSEKPADVGDSRVVLNLEARAGAFVLTAQLSFVFVGFDDHGAKLVAGEGSPFSPDAA